MPAHRKSFNALLAFLILGIIISIAGCQAAPVPPTITTPTAANATSTAANTITPPPVETQAEVNFVVEVPEGTSPDAKVDLNLLDEVTGLAINPVVQSMKLVDARHFEATVRFRLNAVIKYRYSIESSPSTVEYSFGGQAVRYRVCLVAGPMIIQDVISTWKNDSSAQNTGSISGTIADIETQAPIPGLLVTAGGRQAITASDGSFLINDLPEGTHNLVAYAMDGGYRTFQQGARVAAGTVTPAKITVKAAPRVNITFEVTLPHENVIGLPVRMAGNLLTLGNTFSDLPGGLSTVASRMPLLSQLPDGRYQLTLNLPAGADLEYKYTLGDGFWNTELQADGKFMLRKITIPNQDATITDQIATWRTPGYGPVTIDLKTPADTPPGETISIQFNPFGWTEPVPIWPLGNNHYMFILYNPLNFSGDLSYRFCRNDQCGSNEQAALAGAKTGQGTFTPKVEPQNLQKEITAWDDWQGSTSPSKVVAATIQPRGADFMGGVAFSPGFDPTMTPYFAPAYQSLHSIGANWIVLTPTWSFPSNHAATISQIPGQDALWSDLTATVANARNQGLHVAVFPTPSYPESPDDWWKVAVRNSSWWEEWFQHFRVFLLHHADLAAQTGAGALIIGGDSIGPALPGGVVLGGDPSGVPSDASFRWRKMIDEVRTHFSGKIYWAIDYSGGIQNPPNFLDDVDAIYLEFSAPLTETADYTQDSLVNSLSNILDGEVVAFQKLVEKPIILAPAYPSADGAAQGCVADPNGSQGACLPFEALDRGRKQQAIKPNLQTQVDIYNAIFAVVNNRSWISGVVSQGYYPPAPLQDSSNSIHGKPATDVLWYWFPKLIAPIP